MGHKILLADDSITIQKVIELTFSDEDFDLHTVGNGQKAVDEIRSIRPDIVLCDIIMPEKNGYEVCEFIKSSDDLKHVPVLLLTGAFEPFDQERAKAAGCDGFLAKPFEPQTLISKVKELLARPATPSAATATPPAGASPPPPAGAPSPPPLSADSSESEETVFVAPPSLSPSTPAPFAASGPPSPSASSPDESGGLDEGFAAEAGERELTMGPEDQSALLGEKESSSARPTPSTSDDIWGEVAAPPPEREEDTATVFMAAPPEPAASETTGLGETNDPDTTWQMPPEESEAEPAPEPPSPPEPSGPVSTDELRGFEEFAAPPEAPPAAVPAPPERPPPSTPGPKSEPFSPLESMDMAPDEIESPPGAAFGPPPPPAEPPSPSPAPDEGEMMFEAPPPPPDPRAVTGPEPAPERKPEGAAPTGADGVDDDLVERVAQRVVDKLSEKVIQDIAWEVVPDLAEDLIRKEIDALKAKIPK